MAKYLFPVDKTSIATTSTYNPARIDPINGQVKPHYAWDIAPKTRGVAGDAIMAGLKGVVIHSKFEQSCGNFVTVQYEDGVYALFEHLMEKGLPAGIRFEQGASLGRMGTTGHSTGVHVHMALGTKLTPFGVIDKAEKGKYTINPNTIQWVLKKDWKPSAPANPKKTVEEVAAEIVKGTGGWGNNPERRRKLEAAGYNYEAVQNVVTVLISGHKPAPEPVKKPASIVAAEIVGGTGGWGNNPERRRKLEAAGYNYEEVQTLVNKILKGIQPAAPTVKAGSNVKLKLGARDYSGGRLAAFVYPRVHQVQSIDGDRVVVTFNNQVIAAMHLKDVTLA